MKVAIVTITNRNQNYGNRLQNYAIVYILKKYGFKVKTLNTTKQHSLIKIVAKIIVNRICGYRLSKNQLFYKRQVSFLVFNREHLHLSNELLSGKLNSSKYDFFLLGSDQVWNPTWFDDLKKNAFLLTFAKREQKVCFSPSFGIEELPDEWKDWFKINLSSFKSLSVREKAGAKIIKELTGIDAPVLLDPTLMIDSAQWLKIAKKPKKVDFSKGYILTYVLGEKSKKMIDDIKKYSQSLDLQVYNLMDETQPFIYKSGPSEFLYLIANAKLVVTDSFHACVFSFLFSIPFVVYSREGKNNNMLSRMDTLLETFDLKRKYVNGNLPNELLESNYSEGFKRLKSKRREVEEYLKQALDICE